MYLKSLSTFRSSLICLLRDFCGLMGTLGFSFSIFEKKNPSNWNSDRVSIVPWISKQKKNHESGKVMCRKDGRAIREGEGL